MQAHLTQLRARCGMIYGLLLGLHDRLGALSGWSAPVSQTASDEHQLLARGSGQGVRFALLPSSGPLVRPAGPEEAAKVSARPTKKGANRVRRTGSSRKLWFFSRCRIFYLYNLTFRDLWLLIILVE